MTWTFAVSANIPRVTQTGIDSNLDGLEAVITAVPAVARSTAYTTAQLVKPPTPNGYWYRCSTAGVTGTVAPTYTTTLGGTTTDGTAVFTSFRAPDVQTLGTKKHFYMPDILFNIEGQLTNPNPQISTFTCYTLWVSTTAARFNSGTWASDGVTPLYDGLHFTAVRVGNSHPDDTNGSFRLMAGQCTFIGGEVQVGGSIGLSVGTAVFSYYTRWRSSKQWGGTFKSRFRSYSALSVFRGCEFYALDFDMFHMPAELSVKGRSCEYLLEYVGAAFGGADSYFKASAIENVDGTYDFDNYGSGYVELFNCKSGKDLRVVTLLTTPPATLLKHCVPLYQDIRITAKDTSGVVVPNVRFSCTDTPTNSPTITITTAANLKTWDFRNPLSYQTTTNASGVALSSPVLNVWYYETTQKKNLRFLNSTATYEGRAYNYKTVFTSIVLGSDTIQDASSGMVALDTATILTEASALALGKFTFTASGATGGTVTATANFTANELWDAYRAYIVQFANRASSDTWTCISGNLRMGEWTLTLNTGVTGQEGATVKSIYAPTVNLNGSAQMLMIYSTTVGTSKTVELTVSAGSSIYVGDNATAITKLFNSGVTAGTYRAYYPPSATPPMVLIARELYGSQRYAQVVTLADGLNSFTPVDIPDVGITETTLATVQAYTAIDGPSKRYDRTAAFRLSEQGIKLGQIATRSGTSLEGTFSVVVRDDAPVVYGITGNVITIKAASYEADSRFVKEVVTGGGTFTAFDTELIGIDLEDANGDSTATIAGTTGGLVDAWKCVNGTINADYATGTKIASNLSSGKFRFTGLNGYKLIFFDKNTLMARDCSMSKGIYPLGWYVFDTPQGGLTQDQGVSFTSMVSKVNDIYSDVNGITAGFVESTDSLHALRIAVNSVPSTTATSVWDATTRTLTSDGASGATLSEIEGSLVLAKEATVAALGSPLQAESYVATDNTTIAAIKTKVDTLQNADLSSLATQSDVLAVTDAVWGAETRTLTSSNAATLADIEASTVLAKKTQIDALGSPLQAEYYVAPANADIASIKATVEAIEPVDVSSLATAAQVTALGSPLQAANYTAPPAASSVATAVRTELAPELANLDATVSSRSTLTAQDIPEGLTAAEVWAATDRTLTEVHGLTSTQSEQLRKVAQLHGVGADLVVTETTRTAGDVSQTLTTDDDGNTTVSAA